MSLDEEAEQTQQGLRHARKIENVPTLKTILRQSLSNFEVALNALSPAEREKALSLYLDRIRKVSFAFHLAVLKQTAKRDARKGPADPEALRARLEQYGEDLQRVGRLYHFL